MDIEIAKFPPFYFFGIETFLDKFLMTSGPASGFFGYCKRIVDTEVILLFVSLRYGADLCRSRIFFENIFSRRFMKWNATIQVAFFNPHELTKFY